MNFVKIRFIKVFKKCLMQKHVRVYLNNLYLVNVLIVHVPNFYHNFVLEVTANRKSTDMASC